MSELGFCLSDPLVSSLGGISWLKDLRDGPDAFQSTTGSKPGLIETQASRVGTLQKYGIYMLASRPRLRFAPLEGGTGVYLVNRNGSSGLTVDFSLTLDVPDAQFPSPVAQACLQVEEELQLILQNSAGTNARIVCVKGADDTPFKNALEFVFEDKTSYNAYLSPGLLRFIKIKKTNCSVDFLRSLHYEVRYIGKTGQDLEARFEAHSKIRLLAHQLLTRDLHHEPFVFAFTHKAYLGSLSFTEENCLDALEATLIGAFQPSLNVEHLKFPKGESSREIALQKTVVNADISRIRVDSVKLVQKQRKNKGVRFI